MTTNSGPPRDLSLNNLVVTGTAVLNSATIGRLGATMVDVPFTPTTDFALDGNYSKMIIGINLVSISFVGTVTGAVGTTEISLGTIDPAFAPPHNVFGTTCQTPQGILVFELLPSGDIHTCISGFPFAPGSYPISATITYIL